MRKIRLIAEAVCLITSMTITPVVTSVEKNDSMVVETVAEASQTPVLKSANVIPILQSEDTTNSLKLKMMQMKLQKKQTNLRMKTNPIIRMQTIKSLRKTERNLKRRRIRRNLLQNLNLNIKVLELLK